MASLYTRRLTLHLMRPIKHIRSPPKAPAPDGSRRRAGGGLPTRWVLAMNVSFFQELLGSIAERGRALIERFPDRPMANGREPPVPGAPPAEAPETLESLCRALLSGR